MNLTLKPQPGSANLSGADSSRQERLTSVQSFLFEEPNLPDLPNVTSSPELEDGPLPSSSPTGPKIARSGPAPALASPLAIPAAGSAPPTNATFGPSSPVSLRSASLQMFLASRLRARLAAFGSPEYELTWKEWAMPLGGPICALRASAHRTSGNGFTGWQSPVASEARQGFQDRTRGKKGTQISLTTQAVLNAPSPTSGGGGGQDLRMVYAHHPGLERLTGHENRGNQPRWIVQEPDRPTSEASAACFWSPSRLLQCTDGKARRIEPGSFPLVDGLPGRVGLLRGYGNAIVPQLAAEFIQALTS